MSHECLQRNLGVRGGKRIEQDACLGKHENTRDTVNKLPGHLAVIRPTGWVGVVLLGRCHNVDPNTTM